LAFVPEMQEKSVEALGQFWASQHRGLPIHLSRDAREKSFAVRQTQTRGKQTAASWPRAAMAERESDCWVYKRKLAADGQMSENWHEKYADCAGRRRLVNYCN